MRLVSEQGPDLKEFSDRLARASEWFMRLRGEEASVADLTAFQRWTEEDPENALAYRKISASWDALGQHAVAPEIMLGRRDALEAARRASIRRWGSTRNVARRLAIAAALAGLTLTLGFTLWNTVASRSPVFATGLGERRTLTLTDRSIVTLDARSRIRVDYTERARSIVLEQGRARFAVARDSARPFRVRAGRQTVQALGTEFNVELVSNTVLVTLIEGRVAVMQERAGLLPAALNSKVQGAPIEMRAGQQLVAEAAKPAVVRAGIDLERATAWENGKLFFDNEPLASAAERMNRYANEQIEVDTSAAQVGVSGVFNAGDAAAFVEAVTAYFPVTVGRSDGGGMILTSSASETLKTR